MERLGRGPGRSCGLDTEPRSARGGTRAQPTPVPATGTRSRGLHTQGKASSCSAIAFCTLPVTFRKLRGAATARTAVLCHVLTSHPRTAWAGVAQPQPTVNTRPGRSCMVMGHDQGHVFNMALQLLPRLSPYTTCRSLSVPRSQLLPVTSHQPLIAPAAPRHCRASGSYLLHGSGGLWPAAGGGCSAGMGKQQWAVAVPDPATGPAPSCARSCVSAAAPGPTRCWGWKGRWGRWGVAGKGEAGGRETGPEPLTGD